MAIQKTLKLALSKSTLMIGWRMQIVLTIQQKHTKILENVTMNSLEIILLPEMFLLRFG